MKRLLLILLLLSAFVISQGQSIVKANSFYTTRTATTSGGAEYSDDFESYSAGNLDGNGNWEAWIDHIILYKPSSTVSAYPGNASGLSGAWYDDDFDNDQWSQNGGYTSVNSGYYMGVGVRMSGSGATADGYFYGGGSNGTYMYKVINGAYTTFGSSGDAVEADDVLKITVSGTTITAYKNGSIDTSVGTSGTATDSDLSSGKAGIGGYYSGGNYVPDWSGGDL